MISFIYLLMYVFILFPKSFLFSQTPPQAEAQASKNGEEFLQETPTTKEILEENIHVLVRGNNIFAFELYNLLKSSPGSLCFSPYSISSAMAIPFTGSKGATQQEMRITMHYLTQPKQGNEVFQWLNKFYTTPWYLGLNESRLFLANSLWMQRDYPVVKSYSDRINFFFPGGIRFVDFVRNPEGARYNINAWVREKTHGRIPDEVQKEDISNRTGMVLASGAFMKGVWSFPFNPALTKESPFFLDKNTTMSVNMMSQSGKFRVFRDSEVMVIELPFRGSYKGGPQFAMVIILPISNFGLASIEQKFYYDNWINWITGMRDEACIVLIPKFSNLQSFDITPLLARLGMTLTFSDQADFTDIVAKNNLLFTKVLQGAYLSIDEKGSDAVSANPLSLTDTTAGLPEGALIFKADHPFLYAVMDKMKGTLLFLGRYATPGQITVPQK
jgi:serpin B